MIDSIRLKIASLQAAAAERQPRDLDVVPTIVVADTWLALDSNFVAHLLLLRDATVALPEAPDALAIEERVVHIAGQQRQVVDVSCVLATLDEVFEDFIAAVLERAANMQSAPVAALAAVLHDWRSFLAAGSRPPSVSGLAAIVGELLVVADLTAASAAAVRAWSHSRHDFRSQLDAVEVKTTLSPTSYAVTIHGEDQLQEPSGGSLYLHFVRLEVAPGMGHSVASLTEMLLTRGVAAELLYAGLLAAGIGPVDLQASAAVTFEVRERLTLPVGIAFPRIVASSFANGERPPGVDRLTYQVDLDRLRHNALKAEDWDSLTASMAGGAA